MMPDPVRRDDAESLARTREVAVVAIAVSFLLGSLSENKDDRTGLQIAARVRCNKRIPRIVS
jgi:hypothetical protein